MLESPKKIKDYLRIRHRESVLLVVLVCILIFILLQRLSKSTQDNVNELYLLSAISQSLAALFGLVFTISLVMLQVAERHRGLLGQFLRDSFCRIYPVLNAVGIVYPFILLKTGATQLSVNLAIALAAACVLLVIPYFQRMIDLVEVGVQYKTAIDHAKQAIVGEDWDGYRQSFWALVFLVEKAANQRRKAWLMDMLLQICALVRMCESRGIEASNYLTDTITGLCVAFGVGLTSGLLQQLVPDILFPEIARVVTDPISLTKDSLRELLNMLGDIAKEVENDRFKKAALASAWVLLARWSATHPEEPNDAYIRQELQELTKKTNRDFLLACNQPQQPFDHVINAQHQLDDNPISSKALTRWRDWVERSTRAPLSPNATPTPTP